MFAVAVFAATASVQYLGAFATYDAMALMLLAAAARLAVAAASRNRLAWQMTSAVASGMILAVADATKYAATLWDPVVATLVILAVTHSGGWKRGLAAGAACLSALTVTAGAALYAGGRPYWRGIRFTTLSRQHGTSSAHGIILTAGGWLLIVAVLSVIGAAVVTATRREPAIRAAAWVLAAAALLAPANQARIHVFVSLFKHVGFGAWFAAAVAGFAWRHCLMRCRW